MVLSQYLFACALADKRGKFTKDMRRDLVQSLRELQLRQRLCLATSNVCER